MCLKQIKASLDAGFRRHEGIMAAVAIFDKLLSPHVTPMICAVIGEPVRLAAQAFPRRVSLARTLSQRLRGDRRRLPYSPPS
jgi:hypothetical protein